MKKYNISYNIIMLLISFIFIILFLLLYILINHKIVNPYIPTNYEKLNNEIIELSDEYSEVIELSIIGKSQQNRNLYLIKLGRGQQKVLFTGSTHGTEYITSAYLLKMTEEYARCYINEQNFGGRNVKQLLDNTTIYIVPMINPDGVEMVLNHHINWRANANGVNLNQNFPTNRWNDIDTGIYQPDINGFRGYSPASEPESKALINLCETYNFKFMLSFHAKGEVLYWTDDNTGIVPGSTKLMKIIEKSTGYKPMESTDNVNSYAGGFENWFRYKYNRPGICIELTPSNDSTDPHNDKYFNSLVWDKAKYLGLDVISDNFL